MKIGSLVVVLSALWLNIAVAGVGLEGGAPDHDESDGAQPVSSVDDDECVAAGQPCEINDPGECCSDTCAAVDGGFACLAQP